MHNKLAKAFYAQAVEKSGLGVAKPVAHFERIVKDVCVAVKYYLEDT